MCQRWRESFENFLADMGECPKGLSIDRYPNNDGDYEPSNCRWATEAQQKRNTSRNLQLTLNGRTQCLMDWAIELKVPYSALKHRYDRGWSDERLLTTPVARHKMKECV